MDSADVIVLDSSDEEANVKHNRKVVAQIEERVQNNKKRKFEIENERKRIKPIKISDVRTDETFVLDEVFNVKIEENINNGETDSRNDIDGNDDLTISKIKISSPRSCSGASANNHEELQKTEINAGFQNLLDACRNADPTSDMELLINKKLVRYYESVHPDFVNSKSFCRNVEKVTNDIKSNPGLVYLKITGIIEELKIRRKSNNTVIANEDVLTTGNERRDNQIKRLNKALYILKKRIAKLEESEVDWDDDNNSSYLLEERYKKRACEIYEKICDITGESKHAHRSLRKPISFTGTVYPEFNKAIQTFVNRTSTFPDFVDVLKCLEYCNKQYNFRLKSDEMKKIAEDAFIKIGRSLQNRRKADLYETVTYFVGTDKDPATEDAPLQSKLLDNKKFHSKINSIIDKFAEQQDNTKVELPSIIENAKSDNDNSITDDQSSDILKTILSTTNGASTSTSSLSSPETHKRTTDTPNTINNNNNKILITDIKSISHLDLSNEVVVLEDDDS